MVYMVNLSLLLVCVKWWLRTLIRGGGYKFPSPHSHFSHFFFIIFFLNFFHTLSYFLHLPPKSFDLSPLSSLYLPVAIPATQAIQVVMISKVCSTYLKKDSCFLKKIKWKKSKAARILQMMRITLGHGK